MYLLCALEPLICFSDSSVRVTENQGPGVFTLLLTNPSSFNIMTTVITTDGTAMGERDTFNIIYIRIWLGMYVVVVWAGRNCLMTKSIHTRQIMSVHVKTDNYVTLLHH